MASLQTLTGSHSHSPSVSEEQKFCWVPAVCHTSGTGHRDELAQALPLMKSPFSHGSSTLTYQLKAFLKLSVESLPDSSPEGTQMHFLQNRPNTQMPQPGEKEGVFHQQHGA